MPAYHVIFQVRLTADVALRTAKNRDVHMHAKKIKANRAFSLPWTEGRPIFRNKRKFLHKKKDQHGHLFIVLKHQNGGRDVM